MKIYTKTGDTGETSLYGGKRVSKDSCRIETYGTADELNSVIGACRSMEESKEIDSILEQIQHDLFTLGADLAAPENSQTKKTIDRIGSSHIEKLERHIDSIQPTLTPLANFILPGGSRLGAMLHFARAVCRRAERLAVRLYREEHIGLQPVVYLNRLSDLLFVLARKANSLRRIPEMKWKP